MMQWNARLAVIAGSALAVTETYVNWGAWQWWPWFVVDYFAALLLVCGGLSWLRTRQVWSGALLAGAWAFTAGMIWMSISGNLEVVYASGDTDRHARLGGAFFYIGLSGLLMGLSLIGFIAAVGHLQRRQTV